MKTVVHQISSDSKFAKKIIAASKRSSKLRQQLINGASEEELRKSGFNLVRPL